MSNENAVVIHIKGTTDGPGGIKQATKDAREDLAELRQEAQKGAEAANEAARGQELLSVAIRGAGLSATAAGAAVAAYVAVEVAAALAYMKSAAALGDLAERYDMNVEKLSAMRVEAELANTSIDKIAQAHRNLATKMLEANSGNDQAIAVFRALNIEWAEADGRLRKVDDVMGDVHDRFSKMEEGEVRLAVAGKLIGKGLADDVLPWLTKTRDQLQKNREEAERLGLVMSVEMARDAKEFDENLKILRLSTEGLAKSLGSDMVGSLVRVTAEMRLARQEGGLLKTVWEGVKQLVQEVAGVGSVEQQRAIAISKMSAAEKKIAWARKTGDRGLERSAQDEFNFYQAERDRHSAVLAVRLGRNDLGEFGTAGDPKTAAPSELLKEEKGGKGRAPKLRGDPDELRRMKQQAAEELKAIKEAEDAAVRAHMASMRRQDEVEAAATARDEAMRRQAQALRESMDPWAAAESAIKGYDELLAHNIITVDEHGRAVSRALDKAQASMKDFTEKGVDGFDRLSETIEGWGRDASRNLSRTAAEGKLSFRSLTDAATSFAQELLAIQIQRRYMDPLLKMGTSWIDRMIDGPRSVGPISPAFQGVGAVPYHTGRGPGESFAPPRIVDPRVFAGAPRFHSGIGPGERPAIIRNDESVLTPGQMRALGPKNVRVELVNHGTPQKVTAAQPSFDPAGLVVRVFLEDLSKNGPMSQTMQTNFGVRRS